ncbi:MAG: hypothetical protein ACRCST_06875 [Turicibacter sp.]
MKKQIFIILALLFTAFYAYDTLIPNVSANTPYQGFEQMIDCYDVENFKTNNYSEPSSSNEMESYPQDDITEYTTKTRNQMGWRCH